jgi:3-oxoacyl-[acyl-carrier protein] reductase
VHCLSLAKAGCRVAVVGHNNMGKAEEVVEEIKTAGGKAIAVKMNVVEPGEVQAGVARIENDLGAIDILVNNAARGIFRAQLIARMNKDDWDRDLAVNLTGPFNTLTTKAGLIGLTKTAALEGARKGVTCNAIILGVFDAGSWHEVTPELQERILDRTAVRRMSTPQELRNFVLFLASEEASYITGEAIGVSGGASLFTF